MLRIMLLIPLERPFLSVIVIVNYDGLLVIVAVCHWDGCWCYVRNYLARYVLHHLARPFKRPFLCMDSGRIMIVTIAYMCDMTRLYV